MKLSRRAVTTTRNHRYLLMNSGKAFDFYFSVFELRERKKHEKWLKRIFIVHKYEGNLKAAQNNATKRKYHKNIIHQTARDCLSIIINALANRIEFDRHSFLHTLRVRSLPWLYSRPVIGIVHRIGVALPEHPPIATRDVLSHLAWSNAFLYWAHRMSSDLRHRIEVDAYDRPFKEKNTTCLCRHTAKDVPERGSMGDCQ